MNKAVYKHFLQTYGRLLGYWVGFVFEIIRNLAVRVWIAVIVAQIAAHLSEGNIEGAKRSVRTEIVRTVVLLAAPTIVMLALNWKLGLVTLGIIIAHRLSTVAGLDRILVMHDGEIMEAGTHKELLALQGRYYSLWQKQSGNVLIKTE